MGWKLNLKSKLLTDMIWEGWAAVYLFLEMLEFWRILSLKNLKNITWWVPVWWELKFLPQPYIHACQTLSHTFTIYFLWALSVVKLCRPLGACHVVKSRFHLHVHSYMLLLFRKYHPHISTIPSPESPKNILLLIRERITKNIFCFPLVK